MAKMSIDEVLDNKYLTDSSLAQQLVIGALSLDDQIIKDHIHQTDAYIEIYGSGPDPVGPSNNEIWYTTTDDEIYDLDGIIEAMVGAGCTYNGPNVVSNVYDEEKQMWCMTFDGDVTVLGDANLDTLTVEGPCFGTNTDFGVECNVKTIVLPKSVTRIGDFAFYNCSGLISVTIGNSVTSIGNDAFSYCSSLTSIEIPDSVTSIGEAAFYECSSLTSVICKATIPPTIGVDAFGNTNDCPIYVPADSVDAYKTSWSEYTDRIVGLLNNNQIRYTANSYLTINDGVNYAEHTFENGVGLVTFNDDLTTLGGSWFGNTFDNYIGNITTLTLPNGVSTIEMSALIGANTVYYEGTQKECVRIIKDVVDGSGAIEYHCFDGIVSDGYVSNVVNPMYLWRVVWLKNLIGEETLNSLMNIIGSVKIDEHPMTAGEFITMLVNGTQETPGLSVYGFSVESQEIQGVTVLVALHIESGHLIRIAKANDYAYVDYEHIVPVAANGSLDPDYMYILLDDTAIGPETTYVSVTIEHEDKTQQTVSLDEGQTYADQGYNGYYSQDTYDSGIETPGQFLVDGLYPIEGTTIYDYCNDTCPEPEESTE